MSETCANCFEELNTEIICPSCGYDNTPTDEYPLALRHNTILNGRYIIDRVIGQGGFGITYLALEYSTKQIVAIKEYFPSELATRIKETNEVHTI